MGVIKHVDKNMEQTHDIVWNDCLNQIKKEVKPQSYKTWFDPIKPIKYDQDILTIQVPNKFFYEWLEQHYLELLKRVIKNEIGPKVKLEYQILIGKNDESGLKSNARVSTSQQPKADQLQSQDIKNPFVIPGIKKLNIDPQLIENYTFDAFVEGDCNRLARSAGLAIVDKPGKTSFNPLVIYGNVGLGKTHLAHAIGNAILERDPKKNVQYVSMEKFSNQMIHAIQTNTVNDFLNFYQLLDVLIVDDIHFLANKVKTQEIFFHIFNQLHQSHKQIILTSDRAPKDLDGMENRLISRFKWGLTADLQAPDLETRMAILQAKMAREGYHIPTKIIEYISYHIKNNIRELEGVLISLIAQSSLNKKEIDVTLAQEVIQQFVNKVNKEVTIEGIQELVSENFDTSVEQLNGKSRKRNVVIARQLSMYLSKKYTKNSLKTIGEYFGGKDHSTVIYSCNAIKDLLETDAKFRMKVHEVERQVRVSLNSSVEE